jgi:hypothetical protein
MLIVQHFKPFRYALRFIHISNSDLVKMQFVEISNSASVILMIVSEFTNNIKISYIYYNGFAKSQLTEN